MEEIIKDFTGRTDIQCNMVISSSGKITAQLLEGAPFDVFISADMSYPQKIYDAGLAVDSPVVYARGKLVLWSTEHEHLNQLKEIEHPDFKYIALANPRVAPYGKAAQQALQYYQLYDKHQKKWVFGESVAQVNQFVISEAVAAGFTAKSVVLSPELKGQGTWIDIDPEAYDPIEQGVVVLKNSPHIDVAIKFKDYLLSKEASKILEKYGYDMP